MTGVTEWAVVFWTPDRREKRFNTQADAMRFAMALPQKARMYIDEVFVGEDVVVK